MERYQRAARERADIWGCLSAAMPALYARNQLAGRGAVAKYLT